MSDYRNDIERLKALLSYDILDTSEEDSFDNLAKLVSIICNTPAAIYTKKLPLKNTIRLKIYAN
jgi:hypothetical protein